MNVNIDWKDKLLTVVNCNLTSSAGSWSLNSSILLSVSWIMPSAAFTASTASYKQELAEFNIPHVDTWGHFQRRVVPGNCSGTDNIIFQTISTTQILSFRRAGQSATNGSQQVIFLCRRCRQHVVTNIKFCTRVWKQFNKCIQPETLTHRPHRVHWLLFSQ